MRRSTTVAIVLVSLATSSIALGWKRDATFGATVHDHEFHKVVIETSECKLRYRLFFSAPAASYAKQGRGIYRFHARIKLENERSVVTQVFNNRAPGERVYDRTFDTAPEGCWAKQEHKLFGVDVEACRGLGCKPDAFR